VTCEPPIRGGHLWAHGGGGKPPQRWCRSPLGVARRPPPSLAIIPQTSIFIFKKIKNLKFLIYFLLRVIHVAFLLNWSGNLTVYVKFVDEKQFKGVIL
jgi:hypothetical protein